MSFPAVNVCHPKPMIWYKKVAISYQKVFMLCQFF